MSNVLEAENIMEERFVAFIDILGFKEVVKSIESNNHANNPDLKKIKSVLNFMDEETTNPNYFSDLPIYVETEEGLIERELGDPRLTYISDCIIISAEPTLDGFKGLSRKIHKITSDLAFDGIFCRGAISKGKLFHKNKIIFGTSYIKACKLEEEVSKFPRVIIDPDILEFFDLSNDKMPLAPAFYGKDKDGLYYQRYWTWFLFPPYSEDWESYLMIVRQRIIENLDRFNDVENIKEKYIWLKDEFNSLIAWWSDLGLDSIELINEKT